MKRIYYIGVFLFAIISIAIITCNHELYQGKKELQLTDTIYNNKTHPLARVELLCNQFDSLWNNKEYYEALLNGTELVHYISDIPDNLYQPYQGIIAIHLFNVAECFEYWGRYQDALIVEEFIYSSLLEDYGLLDRNTLHSLLELSIKLFNIGATDEAINAVLTIIDNTEDYSEFKDIRASAFLRLSEFFRSRDTEKAFYAAIGSYGIRKELYGEDHPLSMAAMFNIGLNWVCMGNVDEGLKRMLQALSIIGKNKSDMPVFYIQALFSIASIYRDLQDINNAIIFARKNLSETIDYYGKNNYLVIRTYAFLAECYYDQNDEIQTIKTAQEASDLYIKYIIQESFAKDERERDLFINSGYIHDWFDIVLPQIAHKYRHNNDFISAFFNYQLFRNQILLKMENIFLIGRNEAENLQQESLTFSKKLNISWEDLQSNISNDEILIQFISFPDSVFSTQTQYSALTIKKGDRYPHYTPLFICDEDELTSSIVHNNISDSYYYSLIWEPLKDRLYNIDKIFFTPTGCIHIIGIENLQNVDSLTRKFYRLSSLQKIFNRGKLPSQYKVAYLYGGLSYTIDIQDYIRTNKYQHYYKNKGHNNKRNGFDQLDNTLSEISNISCVLRNNGIKSFLKTSKFGTEESIKQLSGKNIQILHMATHGLYINIKEANNVKMNNNWKFINLTNHNTFEIPQENDLLTRSFLVMAGGNLLSMRDSTSTILDDGILTAQEIAQLDLHNIDLVVLSACQTALGDINTEGIYGLQRGFKKAGVNTILMSLDKVDDEATKILMVEFYKNLMSGKTKLQSLKDAQLHLRTIENGKYSDPKYWASFIMLDGLN